jgi:predicted phage terminase large subunit-like protein
MSPACSPTRRRGTPSSDSTSGLALVKASPGGLAWQTYRGWQSAPHLNLLNRRLVDAAYGACPRLLVTVPPRHGKSLLCSHYLPAWYLGTFPDRRVILASYEADFAAGWGRKARDVLERHGRLFGVSVRRDSSAANRWDLEGRPGGMVTAGVGGPITGRGADLLLIDDPVKNADEAMSPAVRQKAWDWYLSTAYTRLEPGGAAVLIQTRWHADDLAGRLLARAAEGGERWEVLDLPALAREGDPLGRAPGEALWPARYPAAALEGIRAELGFWFEALYQQRPAPEGGAIFRAEWFAAPRTFTLSGRDGFWLGATGQFVRRDACTLFAVADPATGRSDHGDPTGLGVFASAPGGVLLCLYAAAERLPLEGVVPRLAGLARSWGIDYAAVESNGFQETLRREAKEKLPCPVVGVEPEGRTKLARAQAAVLAAERGDVLVPREGEWVQPFLAELTAWTGRDGDRDDRVDCLAYAVTLAAKYRGRRTMPMALGV